MPFDIAKTIDLVNETKKLEDEFASALFQLGNRLGDGLPAERRLKQGHGTC